MGLEIIIINIIIIIFIIIIFIIFIILLLLFYYYYVYTAHWLYKSRACGGGLYLAIHASKTCQ